MGHAFSGTCGSERHMFRKKTKTSHAAAGEIHPGLTRSLLEKLVSPPAGRNRASFFTNMWLTEPHVREKDKKVPCCRRRRLPLWEHMSDLYAHRVSPVMYRTYAVLHLETYFASGRAEQTTFFTKFLHNVQKFREKDHSVPCCRRRIGPFISIKRPVCTSTA
jgi:hypothetical protein